MLVYWISTTMYFQSCSTGSRFFNSEFWHRFPTEDYEEPTWDKSSIPQTMMKWSGQLLSIIIIAYIALTQCHPYNLLVCNIYSGAQSSPWLSTECPFSDNQVIRLSLNHPTIYFSSLFIRVVTMKAWPKLTQHSGPSLFLSWILTPCRLEQCLLPPSLYSSLPWKLWLQWAIPQFSHFHIYLLLHMATWN